MRQSCCRWTLLWHLHTLHSPYRPVDISTAYNPKARCNVPYQLPSTFPTPFAPPCPRSTYPWQAALPLLVGRFAFIAGRLDIFAAYAHTATIIFLYWPCVASPVFIAYLRRLEGVPVENADAGCCGISDSYGFKKKSTISLRPWARNCSTRFAKAALKRRFQNSEPAAYRSRTAPANSACTRSAFYASGLRPARILRFGLTNTRRGFAILLSTALHTADHILERNSPGRKLTH